MILKYPNNLEVIEILRKIIISQGVIIAVQKEIIKGRDKITNGKNNIRHKRSSKITWSK